MSLFRFLLPRSLSKWDYLLALCVGAVLVFAFAPFEQRWVAWLVPAVFFWLNLHQMQPAQRLRLAWLFGIGIFAGGAHWIYVSIHFFGGANSVIAGVMVAIFALIVGAMLMIFAGLAGYYQKYSPAIKLLLIFPAIWWVAEWLRGWLILGGFPWLQLGHSQIDTWLVGYAPIIGSLGISWVVALGAGALVLMLIGNRHEKIIAIIVFAVTLQAGWMLKGIAWTKPVGEPLFISMIQGNIAQKDKWVPELRNAHVQKHIDLSVAQLVNSHLVIWPETALPDYFQRSMDDVIKPLQAAANKAETEIVMGGFYREEGAKETYNAILKIGESLDVYGKRHLVPFGEYIPLLKYVRWMEKFVRLPYDNVNVWKGNVNLTLAGQPMRMSICYEAVYGEEMLEGLPEATMLVNITNDGWFSGSIEPLQHAEIARMRAVETGRYLLRATNNGFSIIVNSFGEIVNSAPQYEATVIADYAQPMQGRTPYIIWGNYLMASAMLLLLLGLWGYSYYSRKMH